MREVRKITRLNFLLFVMFLFTIYGIGCSTGPRIQQTPEKKIPASVIKPQPKIPDLYWALKEQQIDFEKEINLLRSNLSSVAKILGEIGKKSAKFEISITNLTDGPEKTNFIGRLSKIDDFYTESRGNHEDLADRLPDTNKALRKTAKLLEGVHSRTVPPEILSRQYSQIGNLLANYRDRTRQIYLTSAKVNADLDALIQHTMELTGTSINTTYVENMKRAEYRLEAIKIADTQLDQELSLARTKFSDTEPLVRASPSDTDKEIWHDQEKQLSDLIARQEELDRQISESNSGIQMMARNLQENRRNIDSQQLDMMVSLLRTIATMEKSINIQQDQLSQFNAKLETYRQSIPIITVDFGNNRWMIDSNLGAQTTFEEAKAICRNRGFRLLPPGSSDLLSFQGLDATPGWEWLGEVNRDEVVIGRWGSANSSKKVIYKNVNGALRKLPYRCVFMESTK